MSILDDTKPKPCYRILREMMFAGSETLTAKAIVRTLWLFYGLIFASTVGLIVYSIVSGPDMVKLMPIIVATIFLYLSVALAQMIFVIKQFDSRISKLEAALKETRRPDKPESDS